MSASASIPVISPAPVLDRLIRLMTMKPGDGNNVISFAEWRAKLRPQLVSDLLHDTSIFD